ncbi:hypothetical protein GCM10020221_31170 [Streptomyces thioluteus]|uniref:Transposase n=1 Tax=Streptomyces thioluteus TaxID=66431 RepID=A0ABN3X226_STRTU
MKDGLMRSNGAWLGHGQFVADAAAQRVLRERIHPYTGTASVPRMGPMQIRGRNTSKRRTVGKAGLSGSRRHPHARILRRPTAPVCESGRRNAPRTAQTRCDTGMQQGWLHTTVRRGEPARWDPHFSPGAPVRRTPHALASDDWPNDPRLAAT